MPREIDLEQALGLAQHIQPTSLEAALGGTGLLGLGAASTGQKRRKKLASLLELAQKLQLPEGAEPETMQELLQLAQAKAAGEKPPPATEAEKASNRERLERIKASLRPTPGQTGVISGAEFNRLIGEELFPPESQVSVRQQIAATKGIELQKAQATSAEAIANLQSGRESLRRLDEALKSPRGFKTKLLASTEMTAALDPEAQKFRDDAMEAIDVLTRARTGAGLNKNEQTFYERRLLGLFRRPETIRFTIANLNRLYDTNEALLRSGRRLPGKENREAVKREITAAMLGGGSKTPAPSPASRPPLAPQGFKTIRQKATGKYFFQNLQTGAVRPAE